MKTTGAFALLFASAAVSALAAACASKADDAADVPPVDPSTGLRIADMGPVPPLPEWADNPTNDAKLAVGKAIFFDPRMSGSGTATCGNCHLSLTAYQSATPLDLPDRSYPNLAPSLPRHTPSLLNVAYAKMMRWDGAYFTDLYDMAVFPLAEANMNLSHRLPASDVDEVDLDATKAALAKKLTVDAPGYKKAFQDAFGEDITTLSPEEVWRLAGKAVATYFRRIVSRDSKFDRWNAGDDAAIDASAVRGLALFRGKARCAACHSGPLFSDFAFHNVSSSPPDASGARKDEGRFRVTKKEEDRGRFLTPMLRSVALTSPYFHDGSEVSLINVIKRKMGARGTLDPNRDPILEGVPDLSDAEIGDIIAFLKTLNGAPIPDADLTTPTTMP